MDCLNLSYEVKQPATGSKTPICLSHCQFFASLTCRQSAFRLLHLSKSHLKLAFQFGVFSGLSKWIWANAPVNKFTPVLIYGVKIIFMRAGPATDASLWLSVLWLVCANCSPQLGTRQLKTVSKYYHPIPKIVKSTPILTCSHVHIPKGEPQCGSPSFEPVKNAITANQ